MKIKLEFILFLATVMCAAVLFFKSNDGFLKKEQPPVEVQQEPPLLPQEMPTIFGLIREDHPIANKTLFKGKWKSGEYSGDAECLITKCNSDGNWSGKVIGTWKKSKFEYNLDWRFENNKFIGIAKIKNEEYRWTGRLVMKDGSWVSDVLVFEGEFESPKRKGTFSMSQKDKAW